MTHQFLIGYLGQFGFLAWVLLIGGIALAVWKLKSRQTRTLTIVLIFGLFAAFPGRWAWEVQKRVEHYQTARAMYNERCAKAGYKINKVVEDVDGILLKVRHRVDAYDLMAPGAAFSASAWDEGYISDFLAYRYPSTQSDNSYMVSTTKNPGAIPGFSYVDVIDEKDGQRYRYTGRWEELWQKDKRYLKGDIHFSLDRVPSDEPSPRYAATFEDHVIPEEREYGIASGTVKVIDTQTNEVLGEMVRYVYFPGKIGKGASANWGRADRCPGVAFGSGIETRLFVDHVLVARGASLPPPLK